MNLGVLVEGTEAHKSIISDYDTVYEKLRPLNFF